MPNVLGLDLGTSNSAISLVLHNGGQTRTIVPHERTNYGDNVIPSYISFDADGELMAIGEHARNDYFNGYLVFRHIKRLIGQTYDYVAERIEKNHMPFLEFRGRIKRREDGFISLQVGPREISITEMMSLFIKKLYEDAQNSASKYGDSIDSIVISLPAGTGDFQRQETLQAAVIAGIPKTSVFIIEEPTAAAVAKGLTGTVGKIIVIDVGAGTTDVVIGHISDSGNNISMQLTSRECDDLLGGMDMDYLILEHVLYKNPELRIVYEQIPMQEKNRLMGRIENAKINAVTDGHGTVAAVLSDKDDKKYRVRDDFDEAELYGIVSPIVNGYDSTEGRKGVKVVIENALLQSAGGKQNLVPKVVKELEHVILVGGPCRMSSMFDMLCEIFESNDRITSQLNSLRETRLADTFYMEGVSKGDAMYKGLSINGELPSVTTISNVTIRIFDLYEGGTTPVIAGGTPYETDKGIISTVRVKVHENANRWWVLHEKDSGHNKDKKMWGCDVSDHVIVLPRGGDLEVTYKYTVAGTDPELTSIEGCGLRKIEFPKRKQVSTLGKMLEEGYNGFLSVLKHLPGLVEVARENMYHYLIEEKGLSSADAKRIVQQTLPEGSLENFRRPQIEEAQELDENEIRLALDNGIVKMREGTVINKGLMSQSDIEAMDMTVGFALPRSQTGTQELIGYSHYLLTIALTPTSKHYHDQLYRYLNELEKKPTDKDLAATTATALMVLADVLYDGGAISETLYDNIKQSCLRYRPQ